MHLRESIKMALDALRAHKLRSFLTLLGIIIAVTTLISVVSVIEGMNRYIADRVANMGSNVFSVDRFGIITNSKEWVQAQKRPRILMDDYRFLQERMRMASEVGAMSWGGRYDVRAGDKQQYDVQFRGASPNIIQISTEQVAEGRFISPTDFEHRSMVAFIGTDLVDTLFPHQDPLDKTITVRGQDFRVIGVAKKIGTVFNQSQDNFIYIPLTTLQKIVGTYRTGISIRIQAIGPEYMAQAQDEARLLMRARHHLKFNDKDDFGIVSSDSIYQLWQSLTGTIAMVAVGITAVFLVVGGIVVMNIMLASVIERTHEIGIRKSLGARKRDILIQFLVEAGALSTAGGLLGIFIAFLGTKLMSVLTSIPSALPIGAVVTAVTVSAGIGLFFGIYPASKAARLDPITALRAE
jgi:putative ABC transport system permease protein